MPIPKPRKTLRLHVDGNGTVWSGDDSTLARSSGVTVGEFLSTAGPGTGFAEAEVFRLLGTRHNASLIVGLRKARRGAAIYLANPRICRTNEPADVLQVLWQPEASSRLPGCWHLLSDVDCGTYAMWDEYDREKKVTLRITALGQSHPAWRAIDFIPEHSPVSGCLLLMHILDPRWYLHETKPHRFTRLHDYLGLTQPNAKSFLRETPRGRNYERAIAAFTTWYNINSARQYNIGEATEPEHFLWRIFSAGNRPSDRGLLRATRRLVDLVVHVWLEAVQVAQRDGCFQPSSFFRPSECRAFLCHSQEWQMRRTQSG